MPETTRPITIPPSPTNQVIRDNPASGSSTTPPNQPKIPGGEGNTAGNIRPLKYPSNVDNDTQRYGQTKLAIKIYKNKSQIVNENKNALEDAEGIIESSSQFLNTGQSIRAAGRTNKVDTVIFLPMPLSLKTNYSVSYSDPSLTETLGTVGSMVGTGALKGAADLITRRLPIGGALLQGLANTDFSKYQQVAKFGLAVQGLAINPHQELLLDGVKFREFDITYKMIPKNETESKEIKDIIHAIKSNMHPGLSNSFLFTYPSEFELHFYTGSKDNVNTYLFKTKRCVLYSFDIDYSGGGNFVTFKKEDSGSTDGAPVQIDINMKFKETEILVNSDNELGISNSDSYTF